MAIKGKKKSQSRGSQARRRPATAPRPVTGKTQKPPWYKTTAGQTIAAISVMVLVLVILISVNNARTESQERASTERSFETFTEQLRGVLQSITGPASEMAAATQAPPDDLRAEARNWSEDLGEAQSRAGQLQLQIPEGASAAGDLFAQSMALFKTAADTFATAAGLEGEERTQVLGVAAGQVAAASQVWEAAVTVLDEARDANDLAPSGLRSPTDAPPSATPTPAPTPEATVPVGDDGADGDGGNGGRSNQDDDSDG